MPAGKEPGVAHVSCPFSFSPALPPPLAARAVYPEMVYVCLGSLTWGRVVTVGLLVVQRHQRRLLRVERAAMVHANARQLLRVVPLAFAAGRRGEVGLRRRGFPGPPSATCRHQKRSLRGSHPCDAGGVLVGGKDCVHRGGLCEHVPTSKTGRDACIFLQASSSTGPGKGQTGAMRARERER
jgi:hypothetical protein